MTLYLIAGLFLFGVTVYTLRIREERKQKQSQGDPILGKVDELVTSLKAMNDQLRARIGAVPPAPPTAPEETSTEATKGN